MYFEKESGAIEEINTDGFEFDGSSHGVVSGWHEETMSSRNTGFMSDKTGHDRRRSQRVTQKQKA